jgi:hypothetical protein
MAAAVGQVSILTLFVGYGKPTYVAGREAPSHPLLRRLDLGAHRPQRRRLDLLRARRPRGQPAPDRLRPVAHLV